MKPLAWFRARWMEVKSLDELQQEAQALRLEHARMEHARDEVVAHEM